MTQVEVPAPANDLDVSDTWSDWRRPPPSSIWEKWECMEAGRALPPVLIASCREGPANSQTSEECQCVLRGTPSAPHGAHTRRGLGSVAHGATALEVPP